MQCAIEVYRMRSWYARLHSCLDVLSYSYSISVYLTQTLKKVCAQETSCGLMLAQTAILIFLFCFQILKEISTLFPFFKGNYKGWRDSVRHNLSSYDCFVKVCMLKLYNSMDKNLNWCQISDLKGNTSRGVFCHVTVFN